MSWTEISGIHALRSAAVGCDASRLILRTLASRPPTFSSSFAALGPPHCPPASFASLTPVDANRPARSSLPCRFPSTGPAHRKLGPSMPPAGIRRRPSMDRRCLRRSCAVGCAAVRRVQQVPTDVVNQSLRSTRSRPSASVENRKPGLTRMALTSCKCFCSNDKHISDSKGRGPAWKERELPA